MALTVEQIHETASQLTEQGERPTLAKVRAALGGGSFTTISEAMKTWREAQQSEHALAQVELPERIRARQEASAAELWQAALEEAERRLQAEREALAEARSEAEAQIAEAKEAVETLEQEQAQAQAEIERLQAALESAEKTRDEAQAASAADREAQRQAEQRAVVAESRLEDAQATIAKIIERIPAASKD